MSKKYRGTMHIAAADSRSAKVIMDTILRANIPDPAPVNICVGGHGGNLIILMFDFSKDLSEFEIKAQLMTVWDSTLRDIANLEDTSVNVFCDGH